MTDERTFFTTLEAAASALSPRSRAALAAAAAERGLASLEASGGLPLEWLERAVELTWAFALGQDVPFDLHREVRHRVEELLDERAYDLLATEDALGNAIAMALAILDPDADPHAMAWSLERAIDGHPARQEAIAWAAAALERVASLDEASLQRTSFGAPETDAEADARRARVLAWREAHAIVPWREPSGMPRRFVVLEVGRARASSRGIVAVSGHALYGVFTRDDDSPGFSLPDAVAYGMAPDERTLFVWRAVQQRGRSGVARADYEWFLERHRWPERTLEARHVVQDREVIAWCTPVRLEVPVEGRGRMVVLRARSEDFAREVFVVDTPEGTRETGDREEALRWSEQG